MEKNIVEKNTNKENVTRITFFLALCTLSMAQLNLSTCHSQWHTDDIVDKSEVFRITENSSNYSCRTLCEKCPNTELFLVRIFPYLD